MATEFPRSLLRERSHSWNLQGVATVPGQTSTSVAPIIRSDGGGFWKCSMADVSLSGGWPNARGRERQRMATLLWRAVRQLCNGGATPIVVPRNDALFRPWPSGEPYALASVPHGDDAFFSDGTGYFPSIINIVASAAVLRSVSLDITINYAGALYGGESFAIYHSTLGWRLYEIATVAMTSVTEATITFNPPLREAIPEATQLEFDRPRCLMRLANPSSMDLAVAPWTFNAASVEFVETFE